MATVTKSSIERLSDQTWLNAEYQNWNAFYRKLLTFAEFAAARAQGKSCRVIKEEIEFERKNEKLKNAKQNKGAYV